MKAQKQFDPRQFVEDIRDHTSFGHCIPEWWEASVLMTAVHKMQRLKLSAEQRAEVFAYLETPEEEVEAAIEEGYAVMWDARRMQEEY